MSNQCESDNRNLQYACLAKHTCVSVMRGVKLCSLQSPRLQRKRMEYSTVSLKWNGRSRLSQEKTAIDTPINCNEVSTFPVSCQLHGEAHRIAVFVKTDRTGAPSKVNNRE